jgi:uncharacterized protein HemX
MGSKLALFLFLVVLGMGAAGSWYYTQTQERIAILTENNAKLKVAVQTSEASITLLEEQAEVNAALNLELQQKLQKSEEYGDELRNTLQKHDLTNLADKRPGSIERKMQNATDQLWDDLRTLTDSDGMLGGAEGDSDSN